MKPRFFVSAGGFPASGLNSVNVEIKVTDSAGLENDAVEFTVDDHGGRTSPPQPGTNLEVWLGYDNPNVFMGSYIVDQVGYEGWPQKIRVIARAADQLETLKKRWTYKYEGKTVKDIVEEVAGRNGLQADVGGDVGAFMYDWIGQHEEADQSFITRLSHKHGATATIKNGILFFLKRGIGRAGSITIQPRVNLIHYRVDWSERPKHSEVVAHWWDREERVRVQVREPSDGQGPEYLIRETYPDQGTAQEKAKDKAVDLKRGKATATFEIEGDPRAAAEQTVVATGCRSMVDGVWVSETVEHRWGPDAATTTITCKPME